MKNTIRLALALFCAGLALCTVTCFSPLSGEGLGTIEFGEGNAHALVDPVTEATTLRYEIVLTGPGGTITRTLEPGTGLRCSVQVVPGTWEAVIYAYDGTTNVLRGVGFTSVEARAGQTARSAADMKTTTAVTSWADLAAKISAADPGEYFLVTGGLSANSTISITGDITIFAEGNRTMERAGGFTAGFFTVASGARLTLGVPASAGGLTLHGGDDWDPGHTTNSGINAAAPLVTVNGGDLVLNRGITLTRNTYNTTTANTGGGGVLVNGGRLDINGAEISHNTLYTASANGIPGGGVLGTNGAQITMNGGALRGNTVLSSGGGDKHSRGGGIALYDLSDLGTTFLMKSGVIENNTVTSIATAAAGSAGGGIFVHFSNFTMKSGFIRNNKVESSPGNSWGVDQGGGVSVHSYSTFTMEGGSIYGNTSYSANTNALVSGYAEGAYSGGIHIDYLSGMTKTGGIVYGSDASGSDSNGIPYRNIATHGPGHDPVTTTAGHAVMVFTAPADVPAKWRNATAGEGVNLDTSSSDAALWPSE